MKKILLSLILGFLLAGCDSGVRPISDDGNAYSTLGHNQQAVIQACREDLRQNKNLAAAHYQIGKIFQEEGSDDLLAIWHFRQFLNCCEDNADPRLPEVRMLLEHTEKKYYRHLRERFDRSTESDSALKVKLLQENNLQMRQWISRLDRENFALREMLLQQRQSSAPPTAPTKSSPQPPATAATDKNIRKVVTHKIVSGDTLSRIAQIYYGSGDPAKIRLLREANPTLADPNRLRVGSSIIIPQDNSATQKP